MKRLLRSNLTPGMIVGEDVFSYANQLIVPKGMVLTDKIITRLEFYSIPYVKVKDDPDEPFDPLLHIVTMRTVQNPLPFWIFHQKHLLIRSLLNPVRNSSNIKQILIKVSMNSKTV